MPIVPFIPEKESYLNNPITKKRREVSMDAAIFVNALQYAPDQVSIARDDNDCSPIAIDFANQLSALGISQNDQYDPVIHLARLTKYQSDPEKISYLVAERLMAMLNSPLYSADEYKRARENFPAYIPTTNYTEIHIAVQGIRYVPGNYDYAKSKKIIANFLHARSILGMAAYYFDFPLDKPKTISSVTGAVIYHIPFREHVLS